MLYHHVLPVWLQNLSLQTSELPVFAQPIFSWHILPEAGPMCFGPHIEPGAWLAWAEWPGASIDSQVLHYAGAMHLSPAPSPWRLLCPQCPQQMSLCGS